MVRCKILWCTKINNIKLASKIGQKLNQVVNILNRSSNKDRTLSHLISKVSRSIELYGPTCQRKADREITSLKKYGTILRKISTDNKQVPTCNWWLYAYSSTWEPASYWRRSCVRLCHIFSTWFFSAVDQQVHIYKASLCWLFFGK